MVQITVDSGTGRLQYTKIQKKIIINAIITTKPKKQIHKGN